MQGGRRREKGKRNEKEKENKRKGMLGLWFGR